MPRFYFDIADHETYIDEVGSVFNSADAARLGSVEYAGNYLKDHADLIWDGRRVSFHVRQDDGAVIFSVVILAVDTPPRKPRAIMNMTLATVEGERL